MILYVDCFKEPTKSMRAKKKFNEITDYKNKSKLQR